MSEPIFVEMMDKFPVYRKRGRFGEYYTWRGVNIGTFFSSVGQKTTMSTGCCNVNEITDDVREKLRALHQSSQEKRNTTILSTASSANANQTTCGHVRKLTPVLHLRRAKNGTPYALYFAEDANEPTRLFFRGFPFGNPIHNPDNVVITWLKTEYNLKID
jgi:hypothetical protein